MTRHKRPWRHGCYIILHIPAGNPYLPAKPAPQIAADSPFELTEDIWIERLGAEFAKQIQQACEPPNYNIYNDVWDRHLYAFMREVPEREATRAPGTVSKDDGLIPLLSTIAMSRLVRPTSTGGRYCANVLPHLGSDYAIQALQLKGVSSDVILGNTTRDWLSTEDGEQLRLLMPLISEDKKMLDRVHRAFWNHEHAMRTFYLDVRWNIVVSGLEALVNVDRDNNKDQFVRRGGQLATLLGVPLSEDDLHNAYKLRNKLAHAKGFLFNLDGVLPQDKHIPLYEKLEALLRAIVKKCLLDDAFGRTFASNKAVKTNWP